MFKRRRLEHEQHQPGSRSDRATCDAHRRLPGPPLPRSGGKFRAITMRRSQRRSGNAALDFPLTISSLRFEGPLPEERPFTLRSRNVDGEPIATARHARARFSASGSHSTISSPVLDARDSFRYRRLRCDARFWKVVEAETALIPLAGKSPDQFGCNLAIKEKKR